MVARTGGNAASLIAFLYLDLFPYFGLAQIEARASNLRKQEGGSCIQKIARHDVSCGAHITGSIFEINTNHNEDEIDNYIVTRVCSYI